MRLRPWLPALSLAALAACASAPTEPPRQAPPEIPSAPPLPAEAPPLGRLPADTRPIRYELVLHVDPGKPRFSGAAEIEVELDRPRDVIWLHGQGLSVQRAAVVPAGGSSRPAQWEQVSKSGVAALRLASRVGPGRVRLHIEYDAPFGGNDEGLYVVSRGSDRYVFSQFEATDARRAFPCFDEPAHKTPFGLTLSVPHGLAAVFNTREVSRGVVPAESDWDRIVFAPTERLPSYLVALAVGPLDIVSAPDIPPSPERRRPLPLRGVATRGRGRELAYALAHAGEVVSALERWFGSEYPYDKLDLLAVPDKSGAMENAGALAFAEGLLLLDEATSTPEARFNFAAVVGHELSHQWFGDLVTMPWWDDLWLNEAFATWMEPHLVSAIRPDLHPEVHALSSAHEAMRADSLVSARKIRQEIADDNDIESAFDSITYDKGGAVLSMFERWLGPQVFQKGVRGYLAAHRHGTAGADDLFSALSAAAGSDVAGPLRTFLDQPGLPAVDASVDCHGSPRLVLRQSRFLPLGSSGSARGSWQIPVCARFGDGKETRERCTLLAAAEGSLPLDLPGGACPAWVMPNADGAGYYRFSLAPADRDKLAAHLSVLGERERMSFAGSLLASFSRGEPFASIVTALSPLAGDRSYAVASAPMDLLSGVARWFDAGPVRAEIESFSAALFTPVHRTLGWDPKKGEPADPGISSRRQGVIDFLALTGRSPDVRREAAKRGRAFLGLDGRPKRAVPPEQVGTALQVAAEEGGAPVFEALLAALAAETRELDRRRLLAALGSAVDPGLAARARALELDPRVRSNEVSRILAAQLRHPETREGAWAFLGAHLDELIARMSAPLVSSLVGAGVPFCDRAHKDEIERIFAPRVAGIEGGPRSLAGALEEMSLCIARRAAQEPAVRAFFASRTKR